MMMLRCHLDGRPQLFEQLRHRLSEDEYRADPRKERMVPDHVGDSVADCFEISHQRQCGRDRHVLGEHVQAVGVLGDHPRMWCWAAFWISWRSCSRDEPMSLRRFWDRAMEL